MGVLKINKPATVPGTMLSKVAPAETMETLTRFIFAHHLDVVAQSKKQAKTLEEQFRDQIRHRMAPDQYAAPTTMAVESLTPVDVGGGRLGSKEELAKERKSQRHSPTGGPVPQAQQLPRAAPAEIIDLDPVPGMEPAPEQLSEEIPRAEAIAKAAGKGSKNKKATSEKLKDKTSQTDTTKKSKKAKKTARSTLYSVQIVAYKDKSAADKLAAQLATTSFGTKYKPFVMQYEQHDGVYHRVRLGKFSSKKDAEALRETIASQEGYAPRVVLYR
jgi:cell division septation protein DedD